MRKTVDSVLNSRAKLQSVGIVCFVMAYVFGSLAIDTASYWQYLLTFVFLILGVKYLSLSFKKNGKK